MIWLPRFSFVLLPLVVVCASHPARAQEGGNPLARTPAPAPDPFAHTFRGAGLGLTLQRADAGYQGTLEQDGKSYPVRAQREGELGIAGTFTVEQTDFAFRARLANGALTLTSGETEYELRADAEGTKDSHGADSAKSGADEQAAPAELTGVFQGAVTPWRHPQGWFTCELPKGWTASKVTDQAVLFNPGFKATDTLDCLLIVAYGKLEENERGVAVAELLDQREPELRQQMATQQQVVLEVPASQANRVRVGEFAGAEQTWKGNANQKAVTMWVGAIVLREHYLAVTAVIVAGKEDRFLPGAKRLFRTLQPMPPQRDNAGETNLVGAEFSGSSTYSGGSMSTIYIFQGEGKVQRRTLTTGSIGISGSVDHESNTAGTYEIVGELLYLHFPGGQLSARVMREGQRVTGLMIGKKVYPRRR